VQGVFSQAIVTKAGRAEGTITVLLLVCVVTLLTVLVAVVDNRLTLYLQAVAIETMHPIMICLLTLFARFFYLGASQAVHFMLQTSRKNLQKG